MKRHLNTTKRQTIQTTKSGSLLVEMTVALGLLVAIAMFLLTGSLDVIKPRNWTIRQNMTDAYLTYEEAYAKRVPFDDLANGTSPWTTTSQTVPDVIMGKTYGGTDITGSVQRILIADLDNGDATTNPAQMETYTLYSVLSYNIGATNYVKSRTVIRSR